MKAPSVLGAAVALCFLFGACGGGSKSAPPVAVTETRAPGSPTPQGTPTPTPTASPTVSATPTATPTAAPTVEPLDAGMPGRELALRFVPAGAKEVSFTDWSLIKSHEAAGDLTGASSFEAKSDFLLALTRTQAPASFYAGSKLKTHYASWSWDTLDLDWEASFSAGGPAFVLKFPESFDLGAVTAHFDEHGYARDEYRGVPLYSHELNVKDEWARTSEFAILNVGVLEKQNILLLATRMDGVRHMIDGVAGGGDRERYRMAVEAMGEVASYTVRPVPSACPFGALEPATPPAAYDVAGVGYRYEGESPLGTIVIGYGSAADAESSVDALSDGADAGKSLRTKKPYAEVAFTLDGSEVMDSVVALRVTPVDGQPRKLFQLIQSGDLGFAPCPDGP